MPLDCKLVMHLCIVFFSTRRPLDRVLFACLSSQQNFHSSPPPRPPSDNVQCVTIQHLAPTRCWCFIENKPTTTTTAASLLLYCARVVTNHPGAFLVKQQDAPRCPASLNGLLQRIYSSSGRRLHSTTTSQGERAPKILIVPNPEYEGAEQLAATANCPVKHVLKINIFLSYLKTFPQHFSPALHVFIVSPPI